MCLGQTTFWFEALHIGLLCYSEERTIHWSLDYDSSSRLLMGRGRADVQMQLRFRTLISHEIAIYRWLVRFASQRSSPTDIEVACVTRSCANTWFKDKAHSQVVRLILCPDDGKVLRQLDIATSQTIAIEIISGVGNVEDDNTPLSLWALGDQMLIRVWQPKVSMGMHASLRVSGG